MPDNLIAVAEEPPIPPPEDPDEEPEEPEDYPPPEVIGPGLVRNASHENDNENIFYITEEPGYHLMNWYESRKFSLPLPYMHYKVQWFPNFGANGAYHLWGAYMGTAPLEEARQVCFPMLPNFYKERPCTGIRGDSFDNLSDMLAAFWSERFNREGNLAWHPTWRQLCYLAGVSTRYRTPVLEYWEDQDIDFVVNTLPWWMDVTLD